MVAGAVYRPAEVTVPDTAVQLVAPGALNCSVPESFSVTVAGEITGAPAAFSVTVATDLPAEFDAVTVSLPDAGMVAGAVYNPAAVTVPDTAVQLVAPGALNCSVPESFTVTVAGEITGAVVPPDPTGTVKVLP